MNDFLGRDIVKEIIKNLEFSLYTVYRIVCKEWKFIIGNNFRKHCEENTILEKNYISLFKYLYDYLILQSSVINIIICYERFEMLIYAVEIKNYFFDNGQIRIACKIGNLNIIKYLYLNGCILNDECTYYASKYGHLETLQWLINKRCPIDKYCISDAKNDVIKNYLSSLIKQN